MSVETAGSGDGVVVHREPQSLGVRGVLAGSVVLIAFVVVAVLVAGDLLSGLLFAVGAFGVRQLMVTGPHLRGVVVTDLETRHVWGRFPHADVRRVEVLGVDEMRAAVKRHDDDGIATHRGLREGARLELVSPEGIERSVLVGARDPHALAAAIERHRGTTRRPELGSAPVARPVRTRQGANWLRAGVPLALAVGIDVVGATIGTGLARAPLVTAVVGAAVLWTALRPVMVDAERIRVGTLSVAGSEVVSVRSAPRGEIAPFKIFARTRTPVWGPPYVLFVVRAPDPERPDASVASRTDVLGIPRPIEVEELDPSTS